MLPKYEPHIPASAGLAATQKSTDGGRMANLGQVKPRLLLENGLLANFTFQAADGIRENGWSTSCGVGGERER